jgi:hypothetical protein
MLRATRSWSRWPSGAPFGGVRLHRVDLADRGRDLGGRLGLVQDGGRLVRVVQGVLQTLQDGADELLDQALVGLDELVAGDDDVAEQVAEVVAVRHDHDVLLGGRLERLLAQQERAQGVHLAAGHQAVERGGLRALHRHLGRVHPGKLGVRREQQLADRAGGGRDGPAGQVGGLGDAGGLGRHDRHQRLLMDGRDGPPIGELAGAGEHLAPGEVHRRELRLARLEQRQVLGVAGALLDVDLQAGLLEVALLLGHPREGVAAHRAEAGHIGDLRQRGRVRFGLLGAAARAGAGGGHQHGGEQCCRQRAETSGHRLPPEIPPVQRRNSPLITSGSRVKRSKARFRPHFRTNGGDTSGAERMRFGLAHLPGRHRGAPSAGGAAASCWKQGRSRSTICSGDASASRPSRSR